VEAHTTEREAAESVLGAYLKALEQGDWARACRYLIASTRAQTEALAAGVAPEQAKAGCGSALETTIRFQKAETRDLADSGVSSLRIKRGKLAGEGAGFALFHGSDDADYWMAMKVEGGEWRVISISPTDLAASR
jgi:hypothetical protein